ncbi:MAG: hypothetical protein M0P10_06905 [Sphaerochaetaceae bacterium]|nr:hypothetical protein [Sphaerochaetaceae bacterium]
MAGEKILLGHGVVSVAGTPIGLTRGGSEFVVDREFRNIEADGDMGPVKGRVTLDSEIAKLTVNALETFTADDMQKYYPALSITEGEGVNTMTGTLEIVEGDYNDVVWVGKTLAGKAVTITVKDALNMDSLSWKLEDKGEVVPALAFTACYDPEAMDTAPWTTEFATV